jgi:hypothetical protein
VLTLLGCQEPFPEDRHDLASFRVVALRAEQAAAGSLRLTALVYPGHGLWHEGVPDVRWSAGAWEASGPLVDVPETYPLELELVATQGDLVETATLALAGPPSPPLIAAWTRGGTSLTLEDIALPIEERAAVVAGEDAPTSPGGSVRLALETIDDGGQFAELGPEATDWFAGTAVLDDGVVESSAPLAAGTWPLVALTFDGEGGNTWTYLDARVDVPGPTLHVGGRTYPVDTAPGPEGWWEATVEAEDSPTGYRLVDVVAVSEPSAPSVCGGSFDPAGIAEGWCPRSEVVGARISLHGEVRP